MYKRAAIDYLRELSENNTATAVTASSSGLTVLGVSHRCAPLWQKQPSHADPDQQE